MEVESVNTAVSVQQNQAVNEKSVNNKQEKKANDGQKNKENVKQQISEGEVIKSIESANEKIQIYNTRLQFSIHEKTKEIMVKVLDSRTEEVIREIPPEKILDMVAKIWELAGIIVDEKV